MTDSTGNVYTFNGLWDGPWPLDNVVDPDGNLTKYTYNYLLDRHGNPNLGSIQYNYYDPSNPASTASVSSMTTAMPATLVSTAANALIDGELHVTVSHQSGSPASAVPVYGWSMTSSQTSSQIVREDYNYAGMKTVEPPTSFTYQDTFSGIGNRSWSTQLIPILTQPVGANLLATNADHCSNWAGAVMQDPTHLEDGPAGQAPKLIDDGPPCTVDSVGFWIDLDGDGRPDFVWGDADGIRFAKNLTLPGGAIQLTPVQMLSGSSGWFSHERNPYPAKLGLSMFNKIGAETVTWADSSGLSYTRETKRMMDFDGDGRLDLVGVGMAPCTSTQLGVRFNKDAGGVPAFGPTQCIDFPVTSGDWSNDGRATAMTSFSVGTDVFAELVDITGDGVIDLVVNDPRGQTMAVYPAYKNSVGAWVFRTWPYNYEGPSRMGYIPVSLHPAGSSLIDVNGDGILDWIALRFQPTIPDPGSVRPLAVPDPICQDIDEHRRYQAVGSPELLEFGNGVGQTSFANTSAGAQWPLWPLQRGGWGTMRYVDLSLFCPKDPNAPFPYADPQAPPRVLTSSMGSGLQWIDVDGDGMLDLVVGDFEVYRGGTNAPGVKEQVVSSITTPKGAVYSFTYVLSSAFPSSDSNAPVYSVLREVKVSGPGLEPSTTRYWYAGQKLRPALNGTMRMETLGFADVWSQNSVSLEVTHAQYSDNHAFAGMVTRTEHGIAAAFGSDPAMPPTFTAAVSFATTLNAKNLANGTCSSAPGLADYPVAVFAASTTQTTTDSGANSISASTTVACADVDGFGRVTSQRVVQDDAWPNPTSPNAVVVKTVYQGLPCWSCISETYTADPRSGADLSRKKYSYDAANRISHIDELVDSSVSPPRYDTPETLIWNANGTLASRIRTYSGQDIAVRTETYTYDSCQMYVTRTAITDDGGNELDVDATYDSRGMLASESYPHLATDTNPPIRYYFYENRNRLAAISNQPPTGNLFLQGVYTEIEYVDLDKAPMTAVKTYNFAVSVTSQFAYGAPPIRDDVTMQVVYYDALGRAVQSRRRLATGQAAAAGANIIGAGIDPSKALVQSSIVYDGVGRVRASFEPYFATSMDYADPRSSPPELWGTRASVMGYDGLSRPICAIYRPIPSSGNIPPPIVDAALCTNSFGEDASYVRATSMQYGFEKLTNGQTYATSDVIQPWNTSASATRTYRDAAGIVQFTKDAYGNYTQLIHDLLGHETGSVRFSGAVGTNPSVTMSRMLDLRGRVIQETDPSSGTRSFSYLQTGEMVSMQQAPNANYASSPSEVVYTVGSLGRIVRRDLIRSSVHNGDCSVGTEDKTDHYYYDRAYVDSRVGYTSTAGRLSYAYNDAATIAFGYSTEGYMTQRGQYTTATGDDLQLLTRAVAFDGRTLTATASSTYLSSPLTFIYSYDSTAHVARVSGVSGVYWQGTPAASGTGIADAVGRTLQSMADVDSTGTTGIVNSRAVSPYSGLVTHQSSAFTPGGTTGGGSLYDAVYAYSGAQLSTATINSVVDPVVDSNVGPSTLVAQYDREGRLTQATVTGLQKYTQSYSHMLTRDFGTGSTIEPSLWNLQAVKSVPTNPPPTAPALLETYSYRPDDGEGLESINTQGSPTQDVFTYDSRGRGLLTQHALSPIEAPPLHRFDYDAAGRLVAISKHGAMLEQIAYGPDDHIVTRKFAAGSPDDMRIYVGEDMTLVARGATKLAYVHLQVNGKRIASVFPTAGPQGVIYYHRDRLGSVVATSSAGRVSGVSYRYQPYGAFTTYGTETDLTRSELGFTGALKLSEGIVHMGARDYWPLTGRWLQPDNLDHRRYTYAGGDPLNSVDPSGHEPDCPDGECVSTPFPTTPPAPDPAYPVEYYGGWGPSSAGGASQLPYRPPANAPSQPRRSGSPMTVAQLLSYTASRSAPSASFNVGGAVELPHLRQAAGLDPCVNSDACTELYFTRTVSWIKSTTTGLITEFHVVVQPHVETYYNHGIDPQKPSRYGRGTTLADKLAHNTSLAFHESVHREDIHMLLSMGGIPQPDIRVGMTPEEASMAWDAYAYTGGVLEDWRTFIIQWSIRKTDCLAGAADGIPDPTVCH